MRIVRFADCRTMPWKNGGGETTEIVVSPPGAGLDDFDWRVSMARVAADGPFSSFPSIDRTLAILDGAGLDLTVAGAAPVRLDAGAAPHPFPADVPTAATLVAGPVTDLNVMSRRGRIAHGVEARALASGQRLAVEGLALVVARGAASFSGGHRLAPRDVLVVEAGERWDAIAEADTDLLVVTLRPAALPSGT